MITKNPLDPSDDIALGPNGPIIVLQSQTEYHRPGLPKPPAGWGRVLPTSEEPMEDLYPDLNDSDGEQR